jgi:CheY-like chemotaxis protein
MDFEQNGWRATFRPRESTSHINPSPYKCLTCCLGRSHGVFRQNFYDTPNIETRDAGRKTGIWGETELRVLVVDDDHKLRLAMVQALRWADCEIVEASDGLHALDILSRDDKFDVILSDICMPRMNGIRLLEEVKTSYPNISFVMLSMYSNQAWTVKEIQQREVRYLPKPFSKQQLVNAVYESAQVL